MLHFLVFLAQGHRHPRDLRHRCCRPLLLHQPVPRDKVREREVRHPGGIAPGRKVIKKIWGRCVRKVSRLHSLEKWSLQAPYQKVADRSKLTETEKMLHTAVSLPPKKHTKEMH